MIRLFKSIIIILLLLSFLLFAACTTPGVGNSSPYITNLAANPTTIEINQTTTLTCTATDRGSGKTVTWKAPSTAGTYTVTCTVSDGRGGEDNDSVSIDVNKLTEEDKIKNVINGIAQALSDKDWDKAKNYCVYRSVVYNEINDMEQECYNNPSDCANNANYIAIDNISPIIINGQYAEAYVYSTVVSTYNGEVEEYTGEQWQYLQKIADDWKLYDYLY
jgi:hypothetical protein